MVFCDSWLSFALTISGISLKETSCRKLWCSSQKKYILGFDQGLYAKKLYQICLYKRLFAVIKKWLQMKQLQPILFIFQSLTYLFFLLTGLEYWFKTLICQLMYFFTGLTENQLNKGTRISGAAVILRFIVTGGCFSLHRAVLFLVFLTGRISIRLLWWWTPVVH